MTRALPAKVRAWIAEPLSDEVAKSVERLARLEDVHRIALMPDVHLAENVCVGAVVATERCVYPDAVGGDIGCGMAAIRLQGVSHLELDGRVADRILSGFRTPVPTGKWATRQELPPGLAETALSDPKLERIVEREGRVQLGTLGRGNHFLELQTDDEGEVWLMVHSGSRALGPAVRQHHLRHANQGSSTVRGMVGESPEGRAYLSDADIAVCFAKTSRRSMLQRAADVLGDVVGATADWTTFVDCTHNYVRREECDGLLLWVHRKGAISASEGEPGIIPGSMGSTSFVPSALTGPRVWGPRAG